MSALILVACSTLPTSTPSTDQFPPKLETQMAQIVKDQMTKFLIPGVIAGVWIPGRGTWIHTAGVSNLDSGEPMNPTMHFHIASNTKTFTPTTARSLASDISSRLASIHSIRCDSGFYRVLPAPTIGRDQCLPVLPGDQPLTVRPGRDQQIRRSTQWNQLPLGAVGACQKSSPAANRQ